MGSNPTLSAIFMWAEYGVSLSAHLLGPCAANASERCQVLTEAALRSAVRVPQFAWEVALRVAPFWDEDGVFNVSRAIPDMATSAL